MWVVLTVAAEITPLATFWRSWPQSMWRMMICCSLGAFKYNPMGRIGIAKQRAHVTRQAQQIPNAKAQELAKLQTLPGFEQTLHAGPGRVGM